MGIGRAVVHCTMPAMPSHLVQEINAGTVKKAFNVCINFIDYYRLVSAIPTNGLHN